MASATALEELIKRASTLLSGCDCESACLSCLKHFGNKRLHVSLDRFAALELLEYVTTGFVREETRHSAPVLFVPLIEALTQEGVSCSMDGDVLTASVGRREVEVSAIPDMTIKEIQRGIVQLWEGEIEHGLPGAFDEVISALA